jgi:small-conductance mechanosensitive channel
LKATLDEVTIMSAFSHFLALAREIVNFPLLTLGQLSVTLWTLIRLVILFGVLILFADRLKAWVSRRVLVRWGVELGVREAIGSLARYTVLAIGLMVVLESVGINLSTLTVFAGALGIGVGFGLQTIANNFVSGLIILFERPIKVGDRVAVGDVLGAVVSISARATTIVTNDNIAVIVPNSAFISQQVTNWSYTGPDVRFNIPIGVAYASDPDVVRQLLLEVADHHPGVLKQPAPDVLFDAFGDSSLNFVLRVWTREYTARPGVLRSELNFLISQTFRFHGIEIPFPQRDVHIRNGPISDLAGGSSPRP